MTDLDIVLEKWKGLVGKKVEISGLLVKGVFKVLEAGKYGIVLENPEFSKGTSTGNIKRFPLTSMVSCRAEVCE